MEQNKPNNPAQGGAVKDAPKDQKEPVKLSKEEISQKLKDAVEEKKEGAAELAEKLGEPAEGSPEAIAAKMAAALAAKSRAAGSMGTGYTAKMLAAELKMDPKRLRSLLRRLWDSDLLAHQYKNRWEWASSEDPQVVAIKKALEA